MNIRILAAVACLTCLSAEVALPQLNTNTFGGPSILSVAGTPLGRAAGQPVGFRVYGSVQGRYGTDLGGPLDSTTGATIRNNNRVGGRAGWGVYGVQQGPRDFIGVDYSGNYVYYSGGYKGAGHSISLSYGRQLSERTTFYIGTTGGRYTFIRGAWRNELFPSDVGDIVDPTGDPFDTTTLAVVATAGVQHRFTETWSVSLSGGGYHAGRKDPRLIDSEGATAGASISRALGPNQRIGGSYGFRYFFFPNGFGESVVHTATVDYSIQFSETWHLRLAVGGSRVDNERLQSVPLDPLLASITGQSSLLQASNILVYRPALGATLGKRFERSSLSFHFRRSMSPGTAFTTTSDHSTGGVSYSYTGLERVSIGFNASADRRSAVFQDVGSYQSYGGGVGMGYRIWEFIHFSANFGVRKYRVHGSTFDRTRGEASVGFTFSPGDTPLALF